MPPYELPLLPRSRPPVAMRAEGERLRNIMLARMRRAEASSDLLQRFRPSPEQQRLYEMMAERMGRAERTAETAAMFEKYRPLSCPLLVLIVGLPDATGETGEIGETEKCR